MLGKITEQELEQYGVVSAPDELKGKPADVKAVFDRLVTKLVAVAVNKIVDAHNALDTDVNGRIDGVIEELKNVTRINAENLGSNNIALDKADETVLGEQYNTEELAPTVHGALGVLGPLGSIVGSLTLLAGYKEALAKLAPAYVYMEYWWKRRQAANTFEPTICEAEATDATDCTVVNSIICASYSSSQSVDIQYADGVAHDTEGNVVLVDPVTVTVTAEGTTTSFAENYYFLKGKYIRNNNGYILYVPQDTTLAERRHSSYAWTCCSLSVCRVVANVPARAWEDLHSVERDAYPDSGVEGEWEYQYAGVPMDNVVGGLFPWGARVVTGYATGDNYALSDEPNSITFPFEPKLVFMARSVQDYITENGTYFVWQEGVTTQYVERSSYGTRSRCFRREGNTLYWWTSYSGTPCAICGYYVAFG